MAKSTVSHFFPQVGGYWYEHGVLGLGDNDQVLGLVILGKVLQSTCVGWYLKLDPRYFRGNRYAIVFQGLYHAIGVDTFFGSYPLQNDSYETE